MTVHEHSRLLRWLLPDDKEAFTFGQHVFCRGRASLPLLAHEAAHVGQFRRYGIVGFFRRYWMHQLWNGYVRNPMEIEARERAVRILHAWKRLGYTVEDFLEGRV